MQIANALPMGKPAAHKDKRTTTSADQPPHIQKL